MKKKYIETPLVEAYLQSISGIKTIETNPFFYARLKARMEKEWAKNQQASNLKLIFIICTLAIFLTINCFILLQQHALQTNQINNAIQQNFTNTYSIGNSFTY